jgi:predicted acyl esterase
VVDEPAVNIFVEGESMTEMIGSGAAHVFVEIDTDDTNLIPCLWDEAPIGNRQLVTRGFLKASHRELDNRTTEGNPYHAHTRAVPVEPGEVEEYVVRLYRFANAFRPGTAFGDRRPRLDLPSRRIAPTSPSRRGTAITWPGRSCVYRPCP